MRTRTRLTTPPGHEPATPHEQADTTERYVPGLTLPTEPSYPGPRRKLWVALIAIALVALIGYVGFRVVTAGQTFDPALNRGTSADDQVIEQPSP